MGTTNAPKYIKLDKELKRCEEMHHHHPTYERANSNDADDATVQKTPWVEGYRERETQTIPEFDYFLARRMGKMEPPKLCIRRHSQRVSVVCGLKIADFSCRMIEAVSLIEGGRRIHLAMGGGLNDITFDLPEGVELERFRRFYDLLCAERQRDSGSETITT